MRLRLEDEIPKDSYLELKKEIEQEKIELLGKRRILDAGMVPNEDGEEEPAKRWKIFYYRKWILPNIILIGKWLISSFIPLFL